jgi:hypothetical protein
MNRRAPIAGLPPSAAASAPLSHERVDEWLARAEADADRRGLPELKPILQQFARTTLALRAADRDLDVAAGE